MSFTRVDIQSCRDEIAGQVKTYRDLVGAASKASGMSLVRIDAALSAFEPVFFNNLLVALDARFAPRARGQAGDEVALLAAALLRHGGVLTRDAARPHDADASVLRLDFGERVALNADDFDAVSTAFLAELADRADA